MNNVWTTIATRTPCAVRQSRSRPVFELFNGYAKRYNSRWMHPGSREPRIRNVAGLKANIENHSRCFSTSNILCDRRRGPPAVKGWKSRDGVGRKFEDANVQEPQRAASHTEGLDPSEQDEGLTWRDYDPAGGMPLPNGELSQAEINAVFGAEELDANTGNYILNVMHWRRLSGALIDLQLSFPKNSGVTREQAIRGLQYLRQEMPEVDEEANGRQWAEEENERLQQELRERAVKLKLYRPEELETQEDEPLPPESDQGTEDGRRRNEESVLQTVRQVNEAKWEKEQAEKKVAEEKAELAALQSRRGPLELGAGVQPDTQMILYGPGGISISAPQTKAWLQPVERKPWVKYYEERAQIIKENVVPNLSLLRRLGPSFLLLLATLWFANFLSENYTPPPKEARMWPDYPPSVATLTALTAALGVFFIANRMPPLWRTFSKYFTLVPAYPYAASILGSTLRHDTLTHLATNTATLWLMGLLLHEYVGRGTFLAVFLATSATGGFASLGYHVLRQSWGTYIFGCSNAVLGVVGAVCTLHPHGKVEVMGYQIPVAAWVYLVIWGGLEMVAAVKAPKLGVDHAGHIGGLLGGFLCGMWLRMKARREESSLDDRKEVQGEVKMVKMKE